MRRRLWSVALLLLATALWCASAAGDEWVVITRTPMKHGDLRHSLVRYWHQGDHHIYVLRGQSEQIRTYAAAYNPSAVMPNVQFEAHVLTGEEGLSVHEYMTQQRQLAQRQSHGHDASRPLAYAPYARSARDLSSFVPLDEVATAEVAEQCRTNANVDGRIGYTEGAFSWGIDRVDYNSASLDNNFCAGYTGNGTHIYILDTGVSPHLTFTGRVNQSWSWYTEDNVPLGDGNGHGTHVAGLAASALYGTATSATIHNIQVLDSGGTGSFASIAAGLLWVYEHGQVPGVINMSLGASGIYIEYVAELISSLLVDRGIITVVSAGNAHADACDSFPAAVPQALTVASSSYGDYLSSFSNYGVCVDVIAPGTSIISSIGSGTDAVALSGTSMAAPVTAGLLALVQEKVVLEVAAVTRHSSVHGTTAAYHTFYGTRAYREFQRLITVRTLVAPNPEDVINLLLHDAHYGAIRSLPAGTPNVMPLSVRTEPAEYPVDDPPPAFSQASRQASEPTYTIPAAVISYVILSVFVYCM